MLRKWSVVVLALLAAPLLAHAQGTGKVAGVVTDASTGESLPGAQILLVGTTLGAQSNIDGNYFIIGVPVGTYDVQASFVGYQSETIVGAEVNGGYTRELNFTLQPGLELEDVLVQYERPLIQKDAIGVPKVKVAEEIVDLPVRGSAAITKTQAGVVSKEGSGSLNIRGGRGREARYYVDGVKSASTGVPQAAVQEQEMQIGSISARYGDAMSGVISITTKSGRPNYFGSMEALSSNQFDPYGYNLGAASLGGPIMSNKLTFFVSGEYVDRQDRGPRNVSTLTLSDAQLQDLIDAPIGFMVTGPDGNGFVVPIPNTLADGAHILVDSNGDVDFSGGGLTFSDGTFIGMPEGSTVSFNAINRTELLTERDFTQEYKKHGRKSRALRFAGNLTWNVIESGRLRLGAALQTGDSQGSVGGTTEIFRRNVWSASEYFNGQLHARWTQYLSQSTFYQIQAEMRFTDNEGWDPRFGRTEADWWQYRDVDNPVHASIAGYKNLSFTEVEVIDDAGDTLSVQAPTYSRRYQDGLNISTQTTAGLVSITGGGLGYSRNDSRRFRMHGSATTQLGINQLEFGAEYEQGASRGWGVDVYDLARLFADGNPERIGAEDTELNPEGYTKLSELPTWLLAQVVGGTGYMLDGKTKWDSEAHYFTEDGYLSNAKDKPEESYLRAPHKPILFGGYMQDKIEFRDIVINLGLRLDVYDNNRLVWRDKYARRPIVRAEEAGVTLPAGIEDDYAVYFSGDDVVGYRDLNGNFYDINGQGVQAAEVLLNGLVRIKDDRVVRKMFEDFKPIWTLMPRVGVSFPITDQALFFASYGVVTQRPGRANADIRCLGATGCSSNPSLSPTNTTKYEIGFRQRVGPRSALTLNGFFHQINNLVQLRDIRGASPSTYSRFENVDFGTVKGLEFSYDLRRTAGVTINANYTLSFARGTGSGDLTTGAIVWIDETPPNFISPLNFDQRHKFNMSVDYSLGQGEGPVLIGTNLLQNMGFSILATAGSGFPYTGILNPIPVGVSRAPLPSGAINNDRMAWNTRIDVRVQRRFRVSDGSRVTAFLWIQNLLNTVNIQNVWRYTGLPGDDGYLATAEGQQEVGNSSPFYPVAYRHRNRSLGNYGIPRLTRLGIRFDF